VTTELYQGIGGGFQEVLKAMTTDFGEETSEYPLITHTNQFRRFKNCLSEIITQMATKCYEGELLYDEFLMDYVLQLLIEMSQSFVRAFRHTGTFCSMKLMSSLVQVKKSVFFLLQKGF